MSPPPSTSETSEPAELAPVESAGQSAGLDQLGEGRQAVVKALKQAGEATADELAGTVGVTVGAIRKHLGPLEEGGLVAHRDERRGRGRPRRWFCLTPAAEALFPKRYGQLTNQLLDFVAEADPGLIDVVFERRRAERGARAARRLGLRGLDGRVQELTAILEEDGYLASCERLGPGHWRIVEHNCAILDVAQRYGHACQSELAFLRDALPGASVRRVSHRLAGGHVCAYDVLRADPPGAPEPA